VNNPEPTGNKEPEVYVDAPIWPHGRMLMCHMFAPSLEHLHAMAENLRIARRWFQDKPGFPHYDICKAKRELAIKNGAVAVASRELVTIVRRRNPRTQRHA
jgi:hypothetical protein